MFEYFIIINNNIVINKIKYFNLLFYYIIKHSGDLVVLDFLLNQNIDIKLNSIIKTGETQTFNSVSKADSDSGYVNKLILINEI